MKTHLNPRQVRKMSNLIVNTAGLSVFSSMTLFSGVFLSAICIYLQLSEVQIGIVHAIPFLVLPFQLISAFFVIRFGKRKTSYLLIGMTRNIAALLITAVFWLSDHFSQSVSIQTFIILFFIFHLLWSLTIPLWFSWVGDIVPIRESSTFWGRRNANIFVYSIFISVFVGYCLDLEIYEKWIYLFLILASACLLILETFLYFIIPDSVETKTAEDFHPIRMILNVFDDRNFRCFLLTYCLFTFATSFSSTFFFIHFRQYLNISNLWIQIFMSMVMMAAFIGSYYWSGLASRRGNKPVMLINLLMLGIIFLGYAFITPTTHYGWIILIFFIDGFIISGINSTANAILTAETPEKNRSLFMAIFFSFSGLVGALGAYASGVYMDYFGNVQGSIFGFPYIGYHGSIYLLSFTMPICALMITYYRQERDASAWNTFSIIFEGSPIRSFFRLIQIKGQTDIESRHKFISQNRSRLFVDDLIEATSDASEPIRCSAVHSLGFINVPESEKILKEKLKDEESGLSVEAAFSLGRLKSKNAVPALIEGLKSQDRSIRSACAYALGEIKDRSTLYILKDCISKEESRFVAASLADALGKFGDLSVIPLIFPIFKEVLDPGVRLQFGVALANMLGKVGEFYKLLIQEKNQPSSASDVLIRRIQKKLKKSSIDYKSSEEIIYNFDREDYNSAIRIIFQMAFRWYYPTLHLEIEPKENICDWTNEDFDRAVGGVDRLVQGTSSVDYSLWLLTILNFKQETNRSPTLEEALLALYILQKIS